MGNRWSQTFPPAPAFTEKDLKNQAGKVFMVTGGSSGIGLKLVEMLYQFNAKIYIAARSGEKSKAVMETIRQRYPESKGSLIYLKLDLEDLTTIRQTADEFLSKEDRLDILWNNAGVMATPDGSTTKQGFETQLGVNNLGPFLLTTLLTPILAHTASTAAPASVRVVWVSSSAAELTAPNGGVEINNLNYQLYRGPLVRYGVSKAGNVFHAGEFARRSSKEGLVSVSLNPGALKTELLRHMPLWQRLMMNVFMYDAIFGAYTELFAGLSPEITMKDNGAWIAPWGRFAPLRQDLVEALKMEADGGTGIAAKFWEWCDEQVKPYKK